MIEERNFGPALVTLENSVQGQSTGPVRIEQIQKAYKDFNAKYFQNKLPEVSIQFANLPGETGAITHYSSTKQGSTGTVDPTSIRIEMNDMFKSPNVHYGQNGGVWSILLHEMTHILMAVQGFVDEHHGPRFRAALQRLAPTTGYSYQDLMGKMQAQESADLNRVLKLAGL